jgi:hypothetical protein
MGMLLLLLLVLVLGLGTVTAEEDEDLPGNPIPTTVVTGELGSVGPAPEAAISIS